VDLTQPDRRELIRIARTTLAEYLQEHRIPPGKPHKANLVVPAAAFVTLRRDGELRGCIGTQRADLPLYRAVQEMAVAAATRDPRFPPVELAELDALTIEISVLAPAERIGGPDDLVIGRDGVTISLHGRRGLLLPQVAVEAGWDGATFLAQLCRKAGLPAIAWRDPAAVLERFTAVVFADEPA
jgi:uncharacterized protein